jgi:hypothetical protein
MKDGRAVVQLHGATEFVLDPDDRILRAKEPSGGSKK